MIGEDVQCSSGGLLIETKLSDSWWHHEDIQIQLHFIIVTSDLSPDHGIHLKIKCRESWEERKDQKGSGFAKNPDDQREKE